MRELKGLKQLRRLREVEGVEGVEVVEGVEENFKTPLLPGGVHPDRCGIAAERLEAGWWNKMRLFSIAADFSRWKKEENVLVENSRVPRCARNDKGLQPPQPLQLLQL